MKKWFQRILLQFSIKRSFLANGFLARPKFKKKHNRFPLNPSSPQATFEDYIYHRMVGPWTPFEEACVDKEYAKLIAPALSPGLKTVQTLAVLPFTPFTSLEDVGRFLHPFIGKNVIAKPTHTSGGTCFLNSPNLKDIVRQTYEMFRFARRNYFFTEFESQYIRLPPKILVEECLPTSNPSGTNPAGYHPPPDFRFYSSKGKLFFCQYDEGRFAQHRQALFTVPEHQPISIPDIFPLPDPLPEKPPHWQEMLQRASELSKPFDFVRVDLYDLVEGVYFSEFTFTPNATVFPFRDLNFSRKLLENVLGNLSEKSPS